MISTAYVAHYNAPKFLAELKDNSMERFNTVVASAFGFAVLIYVSVMVIGFLSFGGHSTGFILNNYASADKLATIARVAIGGGILCGYPLTFTALRDGVADLLQIPAEKVAFDLHIYECFRIQGSCDHFFTERKRLLSYYDRLVRLDYVRCA